MAASQRPSPVGTDRRDTWFDNGTLCLARSPAPGATGVTRNDRTAFDSAIRALESEIANAGSHLSIDAAARQAYTRQIRAMADELGNLASTGRLTWAEAAAQANAARNTIMELIRARSTPLGRALAQQIKSEGKTLNELIARKVQQMHGPAADFNRLTAAQQNAVYAEIVQSAAKSNPRVTATMRRLSRAGRGLLVLAIALSIYTVAHAADPVAAAKHELLVTGAGIAGGIAGGALAGLACGPGAPVCVTVGAFVGGALAAFGVDMF